MYILTSFTVCSRESDSTITLIAHASGARVCAVPAIFTGRSKTDTCNKMFQKFAISGLNFPLKVILSL